MSGGRAHQRLGHLLRRTRRALALAAVTTASVVAPALAGAQPTPTTFPVPAEFLGVDGFSLGPDGNVWFVDPGGPRIGRITPAGTVEDWQFPQPTGQGGETVAGPDGSVWFTVQCDAPCTYAIGRIDPAAPDPGASIELFTHPTLSFPDAITVGPDGLIWWVNLASSSFGHLDPSAPDPGVTIVEVPGGPEVLNPPDLTVGPDQNLWFTSTNDRIGRITPGGSVTTWDGTAAGVSGPVGIVTGPDGLVWFTSFLDQRLGTIDPLAPDPGATITTFTDSQVVGPSAIVVGPDGALWFLDSSASVQQLGRVTIDRSFSFVSSPGAANAALGGLTVGTDCTLWFGIQQPVEIARLDVTCPPPPPPPPPPSPPIVPVTPIVVTPTFTG